MLEKIKEWRNRWLGRPAVRAQLARWPVGRAVAGRHARRLFDLVTGFAHGQMLAAALELGLFDRLAAAGTVAAAEIAGLAAIPVPSGDALVAAMIGLGLWERRGSGRLGLTVDGLVVATDPGIRAMIAHHRLLYADLGDPVALLRMPGGGAVGAFWPYRGHAGDAAGYSRLMADTQAFASEALLDLHDFGRHRHVLDIGGGDGSLAAALVGRWPGLGVTVADLPGVAAVARQSLDARRLDRVEAVAIAPGMAFPHGSDAITLMRVLHDLDDAAALALVRRAAAALPPGGTLVVAEPMVRGGRDPVAAYFAAYFVAMGSGRLRTPRAIRRLLRQAGLRPAARSPAAPLLRIVTATKPSTRIDSP